MRKGLWASSLAALAAAMAAPACAQDGAAAEAGEVIGLEEVVVTAQRRSENLQRAAVAVTAVTGDDVAKAGVSDVANLTKLVPALVVQPNGGSSTNFYLRGVGSYATNAFAENAVAFNFGGVYVARPTSPIGTLFDLERIEVVKGPQGTLYGRNATGGAINVLPRKPALGEIGGEVMLEYGSYDSRKASGALNLALGENLALRVAGQIVDRDGYLSDGYDDEEGQALRASLYYKPTDRLSVLLVGDYFHQGGQGVGSVLVPDALVPTAPWVGDRIAGSDDRSIAELRRRFPLINNGLAEGPRSDGYIDSTFYGVTGVVEYDLGFGVLTAIPAYRLSKPDFVSYNLGFKADITERDEQQSLEVRLASSSDGPLRYVVGAFVFHEQQKADNLFRQGAISTTNFKPRLDTESRAVFGQATYDVTDTFRIVAGARYTKEDKTQATPLRQITPANPNPPFRLVTGELSFEKVTWKAGIEWDAAERTLVYANVATGFKAGGFFVAIRDNAFKPETLTAYTIGAKNRFLDNRLQLNGEAFYWDYEDQQVGFVGPVETAPGVFGAGGKTVNAGNARMYGLEVELLFLLTEDDRFSADVQYLNSKYKSFEYVAISTTGAPIRNGCPATLDTSIPVAAPARLFRIDCSGRPAINAPKWSVNLGYEHTFRLDGGLQLTAGARTRLETSRYLAIDFMPAQKQGRYATGDVYLTLEPEGQKWALTGFVNNVTDEQVFASSSLRPVLAVAYNALRPPRTYGVRLNYKF